MTEKQQQLLFDKGITNIPSDALCSDNTLAESIGMVYDDGEHRVIQEPAQQFYTNSAFTATMLYIHRYNDEKWYIFILHPNRSSEPSSLVWGIVNEVRLINKGVLDDVDFSDLSKLHITSVGKTLIISDVNGLHYFLMKNTGNDDSENWQYINLGEIPMPKPEFQLIPFEANDDPEYIQEGEYHINDSAKKVPGEDVYHYLEPKDLVKNSASHQGIFRTNGWQKPPNDPDDDHSGDKWPDWHQEDYNNLVLGLYAKNKKAAAEKKCFCNPFFVRMALELYDGSYYHITNPVLMMAAVKNNSYARVSTGWNFTLYTFVKQLMVKQKKDYTDWDDIVKDVVVFVSDEIDVNETTMDVRMYKEYTEEDNKGMGTFSCKSLCAESAGGKSEFQEFNNKSLGVDDVRDMTVWINPDGDNEMRPIRNVDYIPYHYVPLHSKTEDDVKESAKAVSVFYKLCKIGKNQINEWTSTREKIEQHVLDTLTSQETLPYDDYFSGCSLQANYIYSYNSRLNITDVRRGFFSGFDTFMPLDGETTPTWHFKVVIETDSGEKTVWHEVKDSAEEMGHYFYYPDPRAKRVSIYNERFVCTRKLEEHPGLHGAYFIDKIYSEDLSPTESETNNVPAGDVLPTPEDLPTYVLTSQVNNPFVFLAEGYNSVGTGRVIGLSSTTQALSEGQFGQYPMLVFATDGIWAMSVDNTGLFKAVHPMSREVVYEENPCITQTDGAVFFASKKGLMVVAGNQVKCVSEQLSGKDISFILNISGNQVEQTVELGSFTTYLKGAYIAYDYRDALLWIFNKKINTDYCWIYAIKSGTFSKRNFMCDYVVNDYPDCLLSDKTNFRTLLDRPNINEDGYYYNGVMITRPMKLENGLSLKSIMQIKNIYDFWDGDEEHTPSIKLKIYASNNFKTWVELTSLRGTPWKYYRFRYDFADLKATDRFAGSIVVTQERRTDKLR